MSNLEYQLFYKRHLPHIQPPGATLFITFRLANSIPIQIQKRLIEEAERIGKSVERIRDLHERKRQADRAKRRAFGRWDRVLDIAQSGPLYLRDRRIAGLVCASLRQRDGKVYDLDSFCIMPNHVHTIFTPAQRQEATYYALSAIMHSLKRYTAREANKLLNRDGDFWQHENYDHVVRNEAELNRIRNYILNNPRKAGLVDSADKWNWSYFKYA